MPHYVMINFGYYACSSMCRCVVYPQIAQCVITNAHVLFITICVYYTYNIEHRWDSKVFLFVFSRDEKLKIVRGWSVFNYTSLDFTIALHHFFLSNHFGITRKFQHKSVLNLINKYKYFIENGIYFSFFAVKNSLNSVQF